MVLLNVWLFLLFVNGFEEDWRVLGLFFLLKMFIEILLMGFLVVLELFWLWFILGDELLEVDILFELFLLFKSFSFLNMFIFKLFL